MHSLMSNGARLDVVLDPYNPLGARVGVWPIGVSSLPVNTASVARNTSPTSTLTSNTASRLANHPVRAARARPPEDQGLCGLGLGGDFGIGETCWFCLCVCMCVFHMHIIKQACIYLFLYMCASSHADCVPAMIRSFPYLVLALFSLSWGRHPNYNQFG